MPATLALDRVSTERLIGRPPRRGDVEAIEDIYGARDVARWANPGGRPLALDGAAGLVERDIAHWRAHGFGRLYWVDTRTSRLVARCGPHLALIEGRPEVELHWAVLPAAQRQGFASEAAEAIAEVCLGVLGLTSVVAFAHEENAASHGVMAAAGLRFERALELDDGPSLLFRRTA